MSIERYDHSTHVARIQSWVQKHRIAMPERTLLSPNGYILDDTAVGWLFLTDSAVAFIDFVAANPEKTAEERDRAIRRLFAHLEGVALHQDRVIVRFMTNLPTMKSRAESLGYTPYGDFGVYGKILKGAL